MKSKYIVVLLLAVATLLGSCREMEVLFPVKINRVDTPKPDADVVGFYQLNEGNMGMNRASIDYFDITEGLYAADIYSEANPDAIKELGDVGNDIQVYGDKVYAVINVSNKVEVLDKHTAKRIAVITIPNCRYIRFNDGKAYVSSYSGAVEISPNAERGFVAEIDTVSLQVTRKVTVGHQPEEMVITNNKLYVANSGGYRVPNYDTTVSVIDLNSFTHAKEIEVAINLHRMAIDKRGMIYVTSRGDYYNIPGNTYVIDSSTDEVVDTLNIPASQLCMSDDLLYYYSSGFSYESGYRFSYGIYDTLNKKVVTDNFITDGTDKKIMMPYGLAVNPETKDIYVSDAQNHIVSGYIYCFTPDGKMKWRVVAGNIPGHFAFIHRDGKPMDNYKKPTEGF